MNLSFIKVSKAFRCPIFQRSVQQDAAPTAVQSRLWPSAALPARISSLGLAGRGCLSSQRHPPLAKGPWRCAKGSRLRMDHRKRSLRPLGCTPHASHEALQFESKPLGLRLAAGANVSSPARKQDYSQPLPQKHASSGALWSKNIMLRASCDPEILSHRLQPYKSP